MIVGRQNRRVHHTRKTRDAGRQCEHHGEPLVDIDAQKANGLTVSHTSAHNHAKRCELKEHEDPPDHQRSESEIDEAPVRIDDRPRLHAQRSAKIKAAGESVRRRRRNRVRTIEILDDLLQNDGQAKGDEDLVRVGTLVKMLDQPAFHHEANRGHDRNRKEDRQRHRPFNDGCAELRAEPIVYVRRLHLQRLAKKICLGFINRSF